MEHEAKLSQIRISRAAPHTGRDTPLARAVLTKETRNAAGKLVRERQLKPEPMQRLTMAALSTVAESNGLPPLTKVEGGFANLDQLPVPTFGEAAFDAAGVRVVFDQIEIEPRGALLFRLGIEFQDADGTIDWKWLRTSLEPDGDFAGMIASIQKYLEREGLPPLPQSEIDAVTPYKDLVQTAEVKSAFAIATATLDAQAVGR
jgi:hypothetical protein